MEWGVSGLNFVYISSSVVAKKNMLKIAVFSGLVTRMESITCRGAF